jgi:hypothetical protein
LEKVPLVVVVLHFILKKNQFNVETLLPDSYDFISVLSPETLRARKGQSVSVHVVVKTKLRMHGHGGTSIQHEQLRGWYELQ